MLTEELNSEKNKNQLLINELNNEKNKNQQLINELNNEKNKNKKLNDELIFNKNINKQLNNISKKEKLTITNFNNKVTELNTKINLLQSDLEAKIIEINNLKNQLNASSSNNSGLELNNIKPGENIIAVHFKSTDQKIDYPMACKNTNIFVNIEQELYKIFPQYKEYCKVFFTVNGTTIKRFKSVDDNKIKNGDKIILNCFEE